MNASERREFIEELKQTLVPEIIGQLDPKFEHIHDLLETIAMAVNAHATVLDDFQPRVKDHDERLERLERTVARIRLAHGLR